jgi:hypothetical protein
MSYIPGARAFHRSARFLQESIKISEPLALGTTFLPSRFRVGDSPLYESALARPISVMKRVSVGFGILGLYLSELVYSSPVLSSDLSYIIAACSTLPLPIIHYFTQDYVSRIFRLYDSEKPQNLENLTTDETLIAEKISLTGRSYYNTILKVSELKLEKSRFGWVNWKTKKSFFYVNDSIGGFNMDRIWGIAEHNSGVDNGRYFSK